MRRFLLLLLVLPLLAGACGDDATEDTPDPPATTLPAGTRDDPFGVGKSVTVSGLPDKLLIGLAANSGDSKKTSEAVFSDVKINGPESDPVGKAFISGLQNEYKYEGDANSLTLYFKDGPTTRVMGLTPQR